MGSAVESGAPFTVQVVTGQEASFTVDLVPGGDGAVSVSVTCAYDVCGLTGLLRAQVRECGGGSVLQTVTLPDPVTLALGVPVSVTLEGLLAGSRCAWAELDVDSGGQLNSGDAVSNAGEVSVTVVAGTTATVPISLDALQP
jgi:hypothetical protein